MAETTSPAPHRRRRRALLEARWSSTPLTPMLKSSRRYHPTAMGSSCTAHSRGCPQAPSVNAGVSRRSRCRWARIRSGIASPLGRRPGECGTGACSSPHSACGRAGIAHSSGPGWVPLSPASPWRAWPGRSKGRPAPCGKLNEIAQFGSMSAIGDGAFSKCHYMSCGTTIGRLIMRTLTRVLVIITLAAAPVTAASAQVANMSPGISTQPQSNPLLNLPSPVPNVSVLPNPIPSPLPSPSPAPVIDGPLSQPLPSQPGAPGAPPSVFGSSPVPSVFQAQ
jgi:hypothetical protein